MNEEQFEEALRRHLHQQPFEAFVVELTDGRTIVIDQPTLIFAGGAATYGTRSQDLVFFDCEEVRAIREFAKEMSS